MTTLNLLTVRKIFGSSGDLPTFIETAPVRLSSRILIIRAAELQDLQVIRLLYEQCGYGGGAETADRIFIAQTEATVVGAVRLCPGDGYTVLRGMQVLSIFQRQRIGTQLLQACAQALADQICYCLPWQHLISFYNQIGFQTLLPTQAPDLLLDRFNAYRDQGMDIGYCPGLNHCVENQHITPSRAIFYG